MRLAAFAIGFATMCLAVAAASLGTHRPDAAVTDALSPAPATSPTQWPDYSFSGAGFVQPAMAEGDTIALGYRLLTQTFGLIGPQAPDAARRFAGNNLACQSCHLDGGTNRTAVPLVGIFRTYPKFSARSGRTISLAERVDECMTRSMNGRALPDGSPEMTALLAYLRYIGEPEAHPIAPAPTAPLPADAGRGAEVHSRTCAACHQADGQGRRLGSSTAALGYEFPPLWGPDSFNDGAGMDRFERAVIFIRNNMPRGTDKAHPQLSLQEAWDVAAFLQSRPRPHYRDAR